MATNQHTLLRQWHMLRFVPRAPRKITVQELCEHLAAEEFVVTVRTVQRDLNELSQLFPLTVDDREKPFGWSWQQDAANFNLPGLAVPEALTLKLVEQHLRDQLPPAALDALQPHFKSADQALSAAKGRSNSRTWLNKVRAVPPVQPLLPPAVNRTCQRTVYDALMQDCQLKVAYKKRDTTRPTVYEVVHPVAVIQRGQLIYLACLFADYDDVRTLAMHRIVSAEKLYAPARKLPEFSIDDFIASGQMGVLAGEPIKLEAIFSRKAGEHLYETPLCKDQSILPLEDGSLHLTATVPHTKELLWWLLGFGDGVQVVAPADVRQQMKETAESMTALYNQ